MSAPTALYLLAILVIGVPSALAVTGTRDLLRLPFSLPTRIRIANPVALAMVGTWLFSRAIWMLTGEWLPVQAMLVQDMTVIAAMFVKEDWTSCTYRGLGHQFACLWTERTPWDRAILAIFPGVWLLYAPIVDPLVQFWALWSLSLAQLMLAGSEALHQRLGIMAIKSRADAPGKPPPRSLFAPVREGVYG